MSSLKSVRNDSAVEVVIGSQTFASGSVVFLSKNNSFFVPGENQGKLLCMLDCSDFVGLDEYDEELSKEESILIINNITDNIIPDGFGCKTTEVYVSTTGCDYTGDGTVENPFANLSRALKEIPQFINENFAIRISNGEYNDVCLTDINFDFGNTGQLVIDGYEGTVLDEAIMVSTAIDKQYYAVGGTLADFTVAGKTWVLNEHFGKVIRVISSITGWVNNSEFTIQKNGVDTISIGATAAELSSGDTFEIRSIGVVINTPDGFTIAANGEHAFSSLGFCNIKFNNAATKQRDYYGYGCGVVIEGDAGIVFASCVITRVSTFGLKICCKHINATMMKSYTMAFASYNSAYTAGLLVASGDDYPVAHKANSVLINCTDRSRLFLITFADQVEVYSTGLELNSCNLQSINIDHGSKVSFNYVNICSDFLVPNVRIDDFSVLDPHYVYLSKTPGDGFQIEDGCTLVLDNVVAPYVTGYAVRMYQLSRVIIHTGNNFVCGLNDMFWNNAGVALPFPIVSATDNAGSWVVVQGAV